MNAAMVLLGLALAVGLQALFEWLANRVPKLLAATGALALTLELWTVVSLLGNPYVGEGHGVLRIVGVVGLAFVGLLALLQALVRKRPWWLALLSSPAEIGAAILMLAAAAYVRDTRMVAVYGTAPDVAESYTQAHDLFSKVFLGSVLGLMLLMPLLPRSGRPGTTTDASAA